MMKPVMVSWWFKELSKFNFTHAKVLAKALTMASRALSLSRTSSLLHLRPVVAGGIAGGCPSGGFRSSTEADVVNNEKKATMGTVSLSTRQAYAIGALASEDLSCNLKELLTVRGVLPDSLTYACKRAPLASSFISTRSFLSFPQISRNPTRNVLPPISLSTSRALRFFSSESGHDDGNSDSSPESSLVQPQAKDASLDIKDVDNAELKKRIDQYFKGEEDALESVLEAILARKMSGEHEDTDDELMDELRLGPVDGVKDEDFESDFEEEYSTDEDIQDLYNAKEHVVKEMMEDDEYFNMDDKKWNDMIREAVQEGDLGDMRECEEILEDMLHFDKLLPDDIKQKVQQKFDELGDKCERKELEPEDAYKLFAEFEDQIVKDYMEKIQVEEPPQLEDLAQPVETRSDDPPGVGPILRWQTRAVFAPGGDAWHPKNRKVKLSVTVKELGLSQYQFRRLREIVGKRYHPGKDELTITSERFEHREENRKDCLRTLLNIIEEAGKADALIQETRTSYVKQRLKSNPAFMARLLAKTKQAAPASLSA